MVVVPPIAPMGAVIASCGMMRRRNEEKENRSQSIDRSVIFKVKEEEAKNDLSQNVVKKDLQKSVIKLEINDESMGIDYSIVNDSDWVKAAWTLIRICEETGKTDQLLEMLENKELNILAGEIK